MIDKEENMCSNCRFQTIFRLIGERTLAVIYKVLRKSTADFANLQISGYFINIIS
jgi:DNA-binding HxlR family transcriptional regulator